MILIFSFIALTVLRGERETAGRDPCRASTNRCQLARCNRPEAAVGPPNTDVHTTANDKDPVVNCRRRDVVSIYQAADINRSPLWSVRSASSRYQELRGLRRLPTEVSSTMHQHYQESFRQTSRHRQNHWLGLRQLQDNR